MTLTTFIRYTAVMCAGLALTFYLAGVEMSPGVNIALIVATSSCALLWAFMPIKCPIRQPVTTGDVYVFSNDGVVPGLPQNPFTSIDIVLSVSKDGEYCRILRQIISLRGTAICYVIPSCSIASVKAGGRKLTHIDDVSPFLAIVAKAELEKAEVQS